ncbi:MAG: putative toxin-antitoxin system toxin component, PIN family [Burkholderiales bacterium]|nr:putative toxin-antitoxin system toxin component, PIN family [Anaerolineae bacterium]
MVQNPPNKLRVMIDANILVAGIGWPRFPYEVLQHAFIGDYVLVLSERIVAEAQRSAERALKARAIVLDEFLEIVTYEITTAPTDEEISANTNLVRDAKDVHVALAAIAAKVDYLVSSDKDLTEPNEALHRQIKVLLPGTFLREYMGWTSEVLETIRTRTWDDLR